MDHTPVAQEQDSVTVEEMLRFFSVLAHDLKSPIFSIDGFSDLLLADYSSKLDEEGVDFLKRVRSSAHQMKRVLDDMGQMVRLLSRPNASRAVDLKEIFEEIRLRFARLLDEGGTKLELHGPWPAVQGDPEKIREALAALVLNAIQFNDHPAGERTIDVRADAAGGDQRICVTDNGMGLDPKYLSQIFQLGLKLDKQRGDGPGYGLYLARRVAEEHGGGIDATSSLGQGSTFCFRLPG